MSRMSGPSDYEINPVMYANLWKASQKYLSVYAKSINRSSQDGLDTDGGRDISGGHTDTCIERLVRIVSSEDKAEQMKARREHIIVYVTNPMTKQ